MVQGKFYMDIKYHYYDPKTNLCVPRFAVWGNKDIQYGDVEVIKTSACLMDLMRKYGELPIYHFENGCLIKGVKRC